MKDIVAKKSPTFKRIQGGIVNLLVTDEFAASILLRLQLIEDDSIPTMSTNGKNLKFSPTFTATLSDAEVTWVLLHEFYHILFEHHLLLARGVASREEVNIGGDLAINSSIRNREGCLKKLLFPGVGDFVSLPDNKNTEWYINTLRERKQKQEEERKKEENQDKEEAGSEDGDEEKQQEKGGKDQDQPTPSDDSPNEESDTDESSGTDEGKDSPGEETIMKESSAGEVEPYPLEDGETIEEAQEQWKEMLVQASQMSPPKPGGEEGHIKQVVSRILQKPQIPPQQILRRFCCETIRAGYTYQKPSRRGAFRRDIILPGHKSSSTGHLVFAIDTSGSMDIEALNKSMDWIEEALLTTRNLKLTIIQCGTEIHYQETFKANEFQFRRNEIEWFGRGGGDLRPPFIAAKELHDVKGIIFFTDLCEEFPEKDPKIPTIWLNTNKYNRSPKVPFGEVINIE